MKKVTKVVGILGGIAALIWTMRDRFIQIAAPKEPEPPTFRVVPPKRDDLTEINGIGPVFASRLVEAGITTFAGLAAADVSTVVDATGISDAKAADWIGLAGAIV